MPTLATFPFRARDAAVGGGVIVTVFKDMAAREAAEMDVTLSDLAYMVRGTRAHTKKALPWLKLARFGEARSHVGSLRHEANMIAISGVELDYDGEVTSFEAARIALMRSRLRGMIYTTPSHTEAKPRWRMLLPASKLLDVAWRPTLVMRARKLFGGGFAPESDVLAQCYFFGAIAGSPAVQVAWYDGRRIDERNDLGVVEARARSSGEGDGRAPLEDVTLWMQGIPNHGVDWNEWNTVGLALWRATGGSESGCILWHEWSARCAKYDARETEARWRHFKRSPPSSIGAGSLYFRFAEAFRVAVDAYDPRGGADEFR